MGIFNFIKKKESKQLLETIKGEEVLDIPQEYLDVSPEIPEEYPDIVKEIHNMFYSAADRLVEEAEEYKKSVQSKEVKKGVSLSNLGFSKAQQVEEAIDTKKKHNLSSEQLSFLGRYRVSYPRNKFIIESQVEEICKKYGLVCGGVSKYTGFVPDKNRKEILDFKGVKKEDKIECEIVTNQNQVIGHVKFSDIINEYLKKSVEEEGKEAYVQFSSSSREINVVGGEEKWGKFSKVRQCSDELLICAPVKDMDMSGMTIEEGYKMIEIPELIDPVVLQRIQGGYLILTAWGPEASDPLVINEINN